MNAAARQTTAAPAQHQLMRRTIPMAIQYFRGSYGKVEMAPMMACIMITVLPVIVLYLICQKYIIDGVVAGAVKG